MALEWERYVRGLFNDSSNMPEEWGLSPDRLRREPACEDHGNTENDESSKHEPQDRVSQDARCREYARVNAGNNFQEHQLNPNPYIIGFNLLVNFLSQPQNESLCTMHTLEYYY